MIELVIPGQPTGKGRPRFTKQGRAFTPAKTKLAENRVYLAWLEAGQPRLENGPLSMRVDFILTRPQNHWKVDGTLSAAGQRAHWPTKKPDVDNACKLIADALNGCAFRDDAQIVWLECVKRWANPGEDEHTKVRLYVLPDVLGDRESGRREFERPR